MSVIATTRQPADTEQQEIAEALRRVVRGPVDTGTRRRAEYSSDASNYRVVPQVVVFPQDVDDAIAVTETALAAGIPLTPRGAGTSVAGNAVGTGIVMDLSRSLTAITDLDPEARTAHVEPGVVLGRLQEAAAPHGLRFGPDPSTWARCTLGGMIGNNACGSHSLAHGRTSDNVIDLDVLDGRLRRYTASEGLGSVPGLDEFTARNLGIFRVELDRFGRQVSGYGLQHLLPENGGNLARALVGSEGTCGVILGATVRLVEVSDRPILLVLGYPTMVDAADAVPAILAHHPDAIEGLDSRLVESVRRAKGDQAVSALPAGGGWLLIEVSGPDPDESLRRARQIAVDAGAVSSRLVPAGAETKAIWRIREDGVGLAGRTAAGKQAWPGFEDAAVPPENLGAYLREFESMLDGYGIDGMPYGHFGDGCVHVRLDIPLEKDGSVLRAMMDDAAHIVARHGGSLSGEHGDGRARSELLPAMYSTAALDAFAGFKALFDPRDLLNPGVLVRPNALDQDLRRPQALPLLRKNGFSFDHDEGDFTKAVHRCVGVGKCRADNTSGGGFMCPSFLATADEKDSTRGRARVLQELANGTLVHGWDSPEVHESLDLCLSCKACSSDCPAGVDMAAYKSEALYRTYEGKIRPISHYVLGWLPRWARMVSPVASLVNTVLQLRPLQKLVLALGGMDTRRHIPRFATRSFTSQQRKKRPKGSGNGPVSIRPRVMLWVDSFSDNFSPAIADAAVSVLESAGYEVIVPPRPVCCGLTWITTGQLPAARTMLTHLVAEFAPYAEAGIPIIGLEPSCTAVLRSDVLELLPGDERAKAVSAGTFTLAELLTAPAPLGPGTRWAPPRLDGRRIVVQPHCHHHAVMGFATDKQFLEGLGAELVTLAGCCGLAGNFGMEKGHYEVSVAVAENALLPALREIDDATVFLADGFSCRTQADQLADATGIHLAELLAQALDSEHGSV
jgi:FAD/FMN-containing dehydrogenase/Fe-S oxidoreductase